MLSVSGFCQHVGGTNMKIKGENGSNSLIFLFFFNMQLVSDHLSDI